MAGEDVGLHHRDAVDDPLLVGDGRAYEGFAAANESSGLASFSLLYFKVRGRAELTRLILEFAGATWEEAHPAWPLEKPRTPYGQLPVLVELRDGKQTMQLAQSHAIERYLARKFGLVPEDPVKAAFADSVFEAYNDLNELWKKVERAGEDVKESLSSTFFSTTFPNFARFHEPLLEQNGRNGLYVGDKITLADLQAFLVLDRIFSVKGEEILISMEGARRTPNLFLVAEKVSSHPRVRQYLKSSRRHPK
ncbi:hypothetical protein HDU67_009015 [Dinochytrium kinnereticum]|nr:hypothetical protein HDU67_009015 [Dinochytrium kinnereticum]